MGQYWPGGKSQSNVKQKVGKAKTAVNPYILRRVSTMFFDEDGDLAHEFYTEVKSQVSGVVTWTMQRVFERLTPQGEVELPFARLSVDIPVVLQESPSTTQHSTTPAVPRRSCDDLF